jgi:hypothetical protein
MPELNYVLFCEPPNLVWGSTPFNQEDSFLDI